VGIGCSAVWLAVGAAEVADGPSCCNGAHSVGLMGGVADTIICALLVVFGARRGPVRVATGEIIQKNTAECPSRKGGGQILPVR
jgi:hypothetical protein